MNKKIVIIEFAQGHGGSFVEFVLSLSPQVFPTVFADKKAKIIDKLKIYSFKDIRKNYPNWMDFHNKDKPTFKKLKLFYHKNNIAYNTIFFRLHAQEIYDPNNLDTLKFLDECKKHNIEIKYFQIIVSEKYIAAIDRFNEEFNFSKYDKVKFFSEQFCKDYNPQQINFDNFIEGEETFLIEYEQLCKNLEIEPVIDDAKILYNDWHKERRFDYYLSL